MQAMSMLLPWGVRQILALEEEQSLSIRIHSALQGHQVVVQECYQTKKNAKKLYSIFCFSTMRFLTSVRGRMFRLVQADMGIILKEMEGVAEVALCWCTHNNRSLCKHQT